MSDNFNIRDFLDTEVMMEEEMDRCEFWCTTNRMVRESGVSNWKECRIQVNDTWDLNTFEDWLNNYHNKKVIEYLRFGWPLNARNTAQSSEVPKNQAGARANPKEVRAYLEK